MVEAAFAFGSLGCRPPRTDQGHRSTILQVELPVDQRAPGLACVGEKHAGRASEPPPDYLAVEAVVRSLYGEPHLIEPFERRQRTQAMYIALQHQVHRHPWLATHAAWVVERAKQTNVIWLLGRPVSD